MKTIISICFLTMISITLCIAQEAPQTVSDETLLELYAVTARYVPTNRKVANDLSPEEFRKWEGNWYGELSPEPFVDFIKKGSVIVIDNQGDGAYHFGQ